MDHQHSSPNHDFSFTISLHSAPNLSPADDLFFHGHLLPLHLISHFPPRSSSTSILHGPPTGTHSKAAKPFSLFGLTKCPKGPQDGPEAKRKTNNVTHLIKRYAKMVLFRRKQVFRKPLFPFSGDLAGFTDSDVMSKQEMMMGWGGQGELCSSAPASMRTSPTNSGPLLATATLPICSTIDSTVEELQAAIQAAITHCKNSIAPEHKFKCNV